jgi:AraC-like DNA-binding protein
MQDANFPLIIDSSSSVAAQVSEWVGRIQSLLPAHSALGRLKVKTYLKMIMVLLAEHFNALQATEESFKRRERDLQRLRPLFDYIDKHYKEVITIEKAAALLYMSKSHFMRFFKRVTGQSFLMQLNRFRLAKAQTLIASTDKTIAEISQEVGFCDQSYFGLIFHRFVGMTPRQYKTYVRETGAAPGAEDKEPDFDAP